ncbi:hypothetical protein [Dysgonomonas sp. HGC4]|uniref:hypothetical protein n=1 Tax=Dysgonomonas sp. HGC4 TaxID=1658009 RepID=UPI0006810BA1|nr:hypothetical protein [Dysgonomonas sp. HGC4]MBD8348564.1 hypothetical protein [Dysgonomonas sp. HGC4]
MDNQRIVITISDHQGLSAVVHATKSDGQWIARDIITEEVNENATAVAMLTNIISEGINNL